MDSTMLSGMDHPSLNEKHHQEDDKQDSYKPLFFPNKLPSLLNPIQKHPKSKCGPRDGNGNHLRGISPADQKERENETEEKKVIAHHIKICLERVLRSPLNDSNPPQQSKKKKNRVEGLL